MKVKSLGPGYVGTVSLACLGRAGHAIVTGISGDDGVSGPYRNKTSVRFLLHLVSVPAPATPKGQYGGICW